MAPRKKSGPTSPNIPSTNMNKLDMITTLAQPREIVVSHEASNASEMLVTMDEQTVRLELKILKKDWPALCSKLCSVKGSKPLDLLYLALSMSGDEDLFFSGGERLLIDSAAKEGSLDAVKQRSAVLIAAGENLRRFVASQDTAKGRAAESSLSAAGAMPKPAAETDAGDQGKPLPPTGQQTPQENLPVPASETSAAAPESGAGKATEMSDEERRRRNREKVKRNMEKNPQLFALPAGKSQPAEQTPQENLPVPASETSALVPETGAEKPTEMSDEERQAADAERRRRNQEVRRQNPNLFAKPLARDP